MNKLVITGTHKAIHDALKRKEEIESKFLKEYNFSEAEFSYEPTTWAYMNMIGEDGWTSEECDNTIYCVLPSREILEKMEFIDVKKIGE